MFPEHTDQTDRQTANLISAISMGEIKIHYYITGTVRQVSLQQRTKKNDCFHTQADTHYCGLNSQQFCPTCFSSRMHPVVPQVY